MRLLRGVLQQDGELLPYDLRDTLVRFLADVDARGFLPLRLYFAAKRYRRWADLSGDPTREARARTVQELYDTYRLDRLAPSYPEVRARLFLETVLRDSAEALVSELREMIGRLRARTLAPEEILDAISLLRTRVVLTQDEDYFLARLGFPHLRPEDTAAFVRAEFGGRRHSEIVVGLEDHEGNRFSVRRAVTPREVGQLHRLFLAAKLDVRFRPEHQYLLALDDRGQILGGMHYEIDESSAAAHLEKIVVGEPWRKKGLADALMKELFHRLRAAGARTVTTGFFRPEFFYGHGFVIEKRYAGLVRSLDPSSGAGLETNRS